MSKVVIQQIYKTTPFISGYKSLLLISHFNSSRWNKRDRLKELLQSIRSTGTIYRVKWNGQPQTFHHRPNLNPTGPLCFFCFWPFSAVTDSLIGWLWLLNSDFSTLRLLISFLYMIFKYFSWLMPESHVITKTSLLHFILIFRDMWMQTGSTQVPTFPNRKPATSNT